MNKTIMLIGQSGKEYMFEIYSIDFEFNEDKCVYVYSKKINDIWDHLYIGQTEHLKTRLNEHKNSKEISDLCIQQSGATHIFVRLNDNEKDRLDIERDIRHKYPFPCNMQGNTVTSEDQALINTAISGCKFGRNYF